MHYIQNLTKPLQTKDYCPVNGFGVPGAPTGGAGGLYGRAGSTGRGASGPGSGMRPPRNPARICVWNSLAAPGLLGKNNVFVPPRVPISRNVSKY